jgi:peptidoglycan hydrolase-like protein with peptidoglycan-binding domain
VAYSGQDERRSAPTKAAPPKSSGGGKDASGHAHVSSGPKGGQFTKSASGSKPKPKAGKSRPAAKGGAAPISSFGPTPSLKEGKDNDPARTKALQQMLRDLKLSNGAVDGNFGPDTTAAVKAVQQRLGLKPTGTATQSLLRRLAEAHALSPCVSKGVHASAGVQIPHTTETDPTLVERLVGATDLPLSLWSDATIWLGEALELDLDDAKAVATSLRDRAAGPAGEWLTLHADDEGVSLLTEDGEGLELSTEDIDHFANQLEGLLGTPVAAAAGHDVTPGHDQLHHYWTQDPEGLARWNTWTELRDQLVEHVGPVKAAVFASAWFKERWGFWSGSDLNRVKNGKPPRGKVVGPG